MDAPFGLNLNLGDSPLAAPLRDGRVSSSLVKLNFTGPHIATQGFGPMVREAAFDGGELAIGTFLQAWQYGKPLALLPAGIVSRFQHGLLVFDSRRRDTLGPADLGGARIGVRSYAQTTGLWLRGHLQDEYGVDLDSIRWVCTEGAHLAEYSDPARVERAPEGGSIDAMLVAGELDAAIPSPALLKDPAMRPVIAEPASAAIARFRAAHPGAMSVNHFFVVDRELFAARPDAVAELYRMLLQARQLAGLAADDLPMGIAAVTPTLELAIRYAVEQKIIDRSVHVPDLFAPLPPALREIMA